ncbi:hypothetical protein [Azospirillum brasilense]|nr:hypothetical protein [Azospirillum brasilense]
MTANRSGEQQKRFLETTRALHCDKGEAAFEDKLRRMAKVK